MSADILRAYSDEVLSFAWAERAEPRPPAPLDQAATDKALARAVRLLEKSGRRHLLLLGLGSGALARDLALALPADVRLLVCCLDPDAARAVRNSGGLEWWTEGSRHGLLADTSAWAAVVLLDLAGLDPAAACLLLNPETREPERSRLVALQRTLSAARPLAAPDLTPDQAPRISAAAILSPQEPDLPAFLAQFPAWLQEVCLVWDAEAVPDLPLACAAPLRQSARPLGRDFAAQRNRMLELCRGDWVFFLDADESLDPEDWRRLPGLAGQGQVAGWHFPRLTFYPDQAHCRMGLGLWPDLQLRLFRRSPGLAFVRPVHERLSGLAGPEALALDLPILHHTHLLKRPEAIRRKLAGFQEAGGLRHTLSPDYPHLPRPLLSPARPPSGARGLLLPPSS